VDIGGVDVSGQGVFRLDCGILPLQTAFSAIPPGRSNSLRYWWMWTLSKLYAVIFGIATGLQYDESISADALGHGLYLHPDDYLGIYSRHLETLFLLLTQS